MLLVLWFCILVLTRSMGYTAVAPAAPATEPRANLGRLGEEVWEVRDRDFRGPFGGPEIDILGSGK